MSVQECKKDDCVYRFNLKHCKPCIHYPENLKTDQYTIITSNGVFNGSIDDLKLLGVGEK